MDARREVLEVPGGSDPTPGACGSRQPACGLECAAASGSTGTTATRLYNHYYTPNPAEWDCGNGSHNKGLSTVRSLHIGGVNVLLCDGSVRFVTNAIDLNTWRGLATRSGGEVINID